MTILLFLAGLVLLVIGGELLVRGASRIAAATGISPLVVGLTIVAFGTSSPELAVSVQAGMRGDVDIAIGNVVGSNIFNVLLILGVSAAIVPLVVSTQLVRLDVPVMVGVSVVFMLMSLDGLVGRGEAFVLVGLLLSYITMQVVLSRRSSTQPTAEEKAEQGRPVVNVVFIFIGLALLVLGSRWLVESAVEIATAFGVTQLVIGLTVVAAGTSMPELATSIIAGVRGQRDIAVGNVIGSNIFNILAVLGITGAISSAGIPVSNAAITLDIPVMLAVAMLCLPIFLTGFSITRWEGILFVFYFCLYTGYLVLDASRHEGFAEYRILVLTVVLPLTLLTLAVSIFRKRHRSGSA